MRAATTQIAGIPFHPRRASPIHPTLLTNTHALSKTPDATLQSKNIKSCYPILTSIPGTLSSNHPRPPQAPRILRASCMSFCMIVTRFACIAHKFESSNRCTRNASAASCSACIACDCHRVTLELTGAILSEISRTYCTLAGTCTMQFP